jgi:hypothetical protein
MDVKISIKDKNTSPETNIFHGNYALELMLVKILVKHYGGKITKEVLKILNRKITDDEINKLLNADVNKLLNKKVL